jgi:hypothetical protein
MTSRGRPHRPAGVAHFIRWPAPMAALELANGSAMAVPNQRPGGGWRRTRVIRLRRAPTFRSAPSSEITFPYGFPQAGYFRLFSRPGGGRVETGGLMRRSNADTTTSTAESPSTRDLAFRRTLLSMQKTLSVAGRGLAAGFRARGGRCLLGRREVFGQLDVGASTDR